MRFQQARQASAPRTNRFSQVVPTSHHQGAHVLRKGCQKPRMNSLPPTKQAFGDAFVSENSQASQTKSTRIDLVLPLGDGSSQAFFLPPIDDASVRTPPPWKPPCMVEGASPKVTFKLPEVTFELPAALHEMESSCASPTKSPGRVGKVFRELLPVTPRKSMHKPSKKVRGQRSDPGQDFRVMRQIGNTINLKMQKQHKLMSFAELRRHLLYRYHSLPKAFQDMESHLENCEHEKRSFRTSLQLADFTQIIALSGIESRDAKHLFQLVDQSGNGHITFEEFRCALLQMPADLLLQDFRGRLLTKSSSIQEAFRQVFSAPGHNDQFVEGSRSFSRKAFASHLSRIAIEEEEASLLFDIFDANASGVVYIEQLQEQLREVAPTISLEEFWQRFNSRWPNIRAAASNGPAGRRRAADLLFKILPATFRGTYADLPLGLSAAAWEMFCAQLDVSPANGEVLFAQCATAKTWQGQKALHSELACPKQVNLRLPVLAARLEELQAECDLDDFFDELLLWSQTPLARQGAGMRQSYGRDMAQRLGFMKTQVSVADSTDFACV